MPKQNGSIEMTQQLTTRRVAAGRARRRSGALGASQGVAAADATLIADATADDLVGYCCEQDDRDIEQGIELSSGSALFPEADWDDGTERRKLRAPRDQSTVHTRGAPLLTASQEVALAQKVEGGDYYARDELALRNLRLVAAVARRYVGRGLPIEDLMQEGFIGLLRAVDKYNYRRGYRFSTYATHWIRQAITRGLANQGRSIRLPAHVVDAIGKVVKVREELHQRLGRAPTLGEVARSTGFTEAKLALLIQSEVPTLSLESPVGTSGDAHLGDFIPADDYNGPSNVVHNDLLHEQIQAALMQLTDRERHVIALRFGLNGEAPHTLEQTGRRLTLTRERVRQLESKAMTRLRHLGCLGQLSEAV